MNQVNVRNHTPLDVATILWLTQERQTRINKGTNNLETVHENTICVKLNSFPDVTASPVPSPLSSPMVRRPLRQLVTRTDSSSSWVLVDQEHVSPPSDGGPGSGRSSSENGESTSDSGGNGGSRSGSGVESPTSEFQASLDDSRAFTSSVMPIKYADLADEVPEDSSIQSATANPSQLKTTEAILNLLYSVNAQSGKAVTCKFKFHKVALLSSFCESDEFQQQLGVQKKPNPFLDSNEFDRSVKLKDYVDGNTVLSLYEELEFNINKMLKSQSSLSGVTDDDIAIAMQQKEMYRFNKTSKVGMGFKVNGGSRLLFLDGGGIKGLVQIEVMRQLEEATGRKITELFDWIVGSSIGAILALGLVYGESLTLKRSAYSSVPPMSLDLLTVCVQRSSSCEKVQKHCSACSARCVLTSPLHVLRHSHVSLLL